MVSSSTKILIEVVVATIGVVVAATAAYMILKDESKHYLKRLKKAGLINPNKSPEGMLDKDYFLDLLRFVGIESKQETKV